MPIYEVGEHDGHHYFSMKLVDGGNLAAQVERFRGAAARGRAAHGDGGPGRSLCASTRHSAPRFETGEHSPLGPERFTARGTGSPGAPISAWPSGSRGKRRRSTQSGSIVGTPSYMAPEQAEGRRESVTTATDVHALGAILFELLTGRPPFRAETMLETLRLVREQDPDHPSAINPRVDRDLETIVLKCLEKNPLKRYHSAEALAEDLERWLADLPIRARPATLSHRAVKWVRRRPAAAGLILVASVATLATAAAIRGYISTSRSFAKTAAAARARRRVLRATAEEAAGRGRRELRQADPDRSTVCWRTSMPTRDDPRLESPPSWKNARRGCEAGSGATSRSG